MYKIGDLVRLVDDPMSFAVKEDDVGLHGVVIKYNDSTKVYTVLLSGEGRTIALLDFMMEKISP